MIKDYNYDYALEHPELCPPVGTEFQVCNQYGVRAKIIVKTVIRGLPGTLEEILPASEQPEHLRDSQILAVHTKGLGQPGWVQWADVNTWNLYQQKMGRASMQIIEEVQNGRYNPGDLQMLGMRE